MQPSILKKTNLSLRSSFNAFSLSVAAVITIFLISCLSKDYPSFPASSLFNPRHPFEEKSNNGISFSTTNSMICCLNFFLVIDTVTFWQWLFRRRRQFALGIYFAMIIHVCLYSKICYNCISDSVV